LLVEISKNYPVATRLLLKFLKLPLWRGVFLRAELEKMRIAFV